MIDWGEYCELVWPSFILVAWMLLVGALLFG